MIIDNFYFFVIRTIGTRNEAYSPLRVDANTKLANSIAAKRLKVVGERRFQVGKSFRDIDHDQFAQCDFLNPNRQFPRKIAIEYFCVSLSAKLLITRKYTCFSCTFDTFIVLYRKLLASNRFVEFL